MRYLRLFPVLPSLLAVSLCGCSGWGTSRWAMDDPTYREKYSHGYSSNDGKKILQMLKRASDARHVDGRKASYRGLAAAIDPATLGVELGAVNYATPAVETRGALRFLIGTGDEDIFTGFDLGLRLQPPSRLAPFVGLGSYLGGTKFPASAEDDDIDHDKDGSVDEDGEMSRGSFEMYGAIYPELGLHFWLKSDVRATVSAQYHFSTAGRKHDYWFIGCSIAELKKPEPEPDGKRSELGDAPPQDVESDPRFLEGLDVDSVDNFPAGEQGIAEFEAVDDSVTGAPEHASAADITRDLTDAFFVDPAIVGPQKSSTGRATLNDLSETADESAVPFLDSALLPDADLFGDPEQATGDALP